MKKLLSLFVLGTLGLAHAHAGIASVTLTPPSAATPGAVILKFNEPIELRFSTFRVVALPVGQLPADVAKAALALKAGAPELANAPLTAKNTVARLTLPLKPGLKPGRYLLAWKLLSEDGHPVTGQNVLRIK